MDGEVSSGLTTTIVFLRRDDEILLAMKKRGFGKGRWNGTGGKLEDNETSVECAKRETEEEIGVRALVLTKVVELTFHEFHEGTPITVHSDVYFCDQWDGSPVETEEMAPRWFKLNMLPYETMWPDDTHWLPRALSGEKLRCTFTLDTEDTILEQDIQVVKEFKNA